MTAQAEKKRMESGQVASPLKLRLICFGIGFSVTGLIAWDVALRFPIAVGILVAGLAPLVFLGVITGVCLFIAGTQVQRSALSMFVLGMVINLLAVGLSLPVRHQHAQQKAERIRAALVVFQARHGHLPKALSELTPDFLSSVPSTGMSFLVPRPFEYEPRTGAISYRGLLSGGYLPLSGTWPQDS